MYIGDVDVVLAPALSVREAVRASIPHIGRDQAQAHRRAVRVGMDRIVYRFGYAACGQGMFSASKTRGP